MAQGLGGYAQTKILKDVHGMPIPGYSRITHSLETSQNMKRRGTIEKEKYI
jgi:hypothetical protein